MLSSIDEKLQLLALDSSEFSQGLAKLTKFYIDNKEEELEEDDGYTNTRSSTIIDNYLALEDNTPILGE